MGWFSKSSSCEDVGTAIAQNCISVLRQVPSGDDAQTQELLSLAIIAHRLGMQFTSLPRDKKQRVVTAFDRALASKVDLNSIGEHLDQRGEQYFKLLNEHVEEIGRGNWKPFAEHLTFTFEQFCLGGGGENSPVVIGGDIMGSLTRGLLANKLFAKSFGDARNIVAKQNPA
jgi:hypothetical protein